ncbi:MAG: CHAT domain-containing protein [Anaerolineae bacterium]|nr:CHAT domain-containing protein [Anaerolineae bacterium]
MNDDHPLPDDDSESHEEANDQGATDQNDELTDLLGSDQLRHFKSLASGSERKARASRPRRTVRKTVFRVTSTDDNHMLFQVFGSQRYRTTESRQVRGWQVDFGTLNVQMNDLGRFIAAYRQQENEAGRAAWRHTAQQIGIHLFRGLLSVDGMLTRQLIDVRRRTRPSENLFFVFKGSRKYLSVPYELLHDGDVPFVVEHPLARRVANVTPNHMQPFNALIDELQQAENPLRVLLIAAGGPGAAEEECAVLYTTLIRQTQELGLPVDIDVLSGREMHLDAVRVKLLQCEYHIVHVVGQVFHNAAAPDEGGLLFAGTHASFGHALLPIHELRMLLERSTTRLFFVSAPIAPQHWDPDSGPYNPPLLRDGDHLDVLAALAQAGVPYVLGFRWYVSDTSKRQFAEIFYAALLAEPLIPELALLQARRTLYTRDQQDEIWASPLLIAQIPHEVESSGER